LLRGQIFWQSLRYGVFVSNETFAPWQAATLLSKYIAKGKKVWGIIGAK
jgi:hypothetical protein